MTTHSSGLHLRKVFFTGIFFLIPIGITWWVLTVLVDKVQGYARPLVEMVVNRFAVDMVAPDWLMTVVSLALVTIFVILIGWLANFYLGTKVLSLVDNIMLRLPVVRFIYGGTKQIIDAFSVQAAGSFKRVVLLEYPRRNCWVLGFVTNEQVDHSRKLYNRDLIAVFVPSTPNPTTGFLLYLDPFDLYLVDLKVDEAVKLIVSAGMVVPPSGKNPPRTLGEDLGLEPPQAEHDEVLVSTS
ncbi:MAG: DUF502 domain-containing protein [Acidobacteriota bacterium]|nr:DUF502 domain-containing protein [Acidobacteriota bacterium]